MKPITQYEVPSLNQIYDMLLNQAQKIYADNYKPDSIVAIARGGIIPARILSDLLEIEELSFIQMQFYTDIAKTRQQPLLKQSLITQITDKKVLLIDDITDSGKSLQLAKIHLTERGAKTIKTATLYVKPQSAAKPEYFEKETSRWVVFPWDAKETVTKIAAGNKGRRTVNREIGKLVKAGLPVQLVEIFLKDTE